MSEFANTTFDRWEDCFKRYRRFGNDYKVVFSFGHLEPLTEQSKWWVGY